MCSLYLRERCRKNSCCLPSNFTSLMLWQLTDPGYFTLHALELYDKLWVQDLVGNPSGRGLNKLASKRASIAIDQSLNRSCPLTFQVNLAYWKSHANSERAWESFYKCLILLNTVLMRFLLGIKWHVCLQRLSDWWVIGKYLYFLLTIHDVQTQINKVLPAAFGFSSPNGFRILDKR